MNENTRPRKAGAALSDKVESHTRESDNQNEHLNALVDDYRNGAADAAQKLIDAFKPLIAKYFRLLRLGLWDARDSDSLKFLQMLSEQGKSPQATADFLSLTLKHYEDRDLEQELILALLTTAGSYTNISFNFKFVLKKRVKQLIKDPLVRMWDPNREVEDVLDGTREEGDIDMDWVRGKGRSDDYQRFGFDRLDELQRMIIKKIYYDGCPEATVARVLHMPPSTLAGHLKRAKQILAASLKFHREAIRELQE